MGRREEPCRDFDTEDSDIPYPRCKLFYGTHCSFCCYSPILAVPALSLAPSYLYILTSSEGQDGFPTDVNKLLLPLPPLFSLYFSSSSLSEMSFSLGAFLGRCMGITGGVQEGM
jgi:hypothetical protein